MVDLLVIHRKPHVIHMHGRRSRRRSGSSCGLAFALVIWAWFGGAAAGEYLSGYLIEESLSIDNVFVWALILAYFLVPPKYQHRVLFWGIFGALVLRAIFIFAGVALIERFDWVLYVFGAFLLYTAGKLIFSDNEHVDPEQEQVPQGRPPDRADRPISSTVRSCSPSRTGSDWPRRCSPCSCWSRRTDVLFAVDSVPAVLAVSREQFIVFASNAFAILGLRALYFLLADMHGPVRATCSRGWRSSSPSSA